MTEMEQVIKNSFTTNAPFLSHVGSIYDIVGWMKKHIYTPKNHSLPHNFKFEMVSGGVNMSYRLWSVDKEWISAGTLVDDGLIGGTGPGLMIPQFEKLDLHSLTAKVTNAHSIAAMTTAQQM